MAKILATKPDKLRSLTTRFMLDVRFFHTKTGMKYEAIGRYAIKNPRFWQRMVDGGSITLEMAQKVYDWMAAQGYHFNPQGDCYVQED